MQIFEDEWRRPMYGSESNSSRDKLALCEPQPFGADLHLQPAVMAKVENKSKKQHFPLILEGEFLLTRRSRNPKCLAIDPHDLCRSVHLAPQSCRCHLKAT
eukprot:CAMPEP_0206506008 /NCGR_PEP_ID=MMETSP0324_2-20121206/56492_1 /ASSEMBLY_ACC=CAM_ASM_000836 /TAXON_ID=2866 /ORGANISM="Crypthecodinium cohnii, Strain Seligo" /LENGTH=100 /DNA_ID=CAMNT_0053995621 /DNA_START=313 /DNA_END=611 /DNA_ORIENTATION=+